MKDRLEEIIQVRKEKLAAFLKAGINPFPSVTKRTHTIDQVKLDFDSLQTKSVTVVGRIRSLREMGKLCFINIEDGYDRIQVLLKEDELGKEDFHFFLKNYDIGDFIEVTGSPFVTKSGEQTIECSEIRLLAKALRPLPSEYYGLEDEEIKLRKRYLDILLNPEVKDIFVKKARFWSAMRDYLVQHGFLEMYMPVLESTPGGAEAEPFVTHHNALDRDFYLRISLELPLKKMLVAGYEKVFEIGRIFRNEGISATHLQDYTQMEFYWAYGDFESMMKFVQSMYQYVIEQTFGRLTIEHEGITVDWSGEWNKVDYIEIFNEQTGIDLIVASDADLKEYCDKNHISYEDFAGRGRLIDLIFKKVRSAIPTNKPVFLINQPIELEPLAKKDPNNPKIVQRMQIIAYGTELGKGFGELNDPIDQLQRFEDQAKLREQGDLEAQMLDQEYVEAMEYGMPPAAGFGISERLFSVLLNRPIRETVVFPPMKEDNSHCVGKARETKIAVALLNEESKLSDWQKLNSIAHLAAAFGAREGKSLFYQDNITTKDKQNIDLNIQHAIMVKSASNDKIMKALLEKAKSNRQIKTTEFTREMIETTDDKKVIELTAGKSFDQIEYLGVLLFGPKSIIEELTKQFPLYT